MKTLVFIGSPHKEGTSYRLAHEIASHLIGEVEYIYIFDYLNVKSCLDCGYCVHNSGCALDQKDGFSIILEKIQASDAFILSSDIWFSNFPGPVLSFFSRMQTWVCGHIFRHDMEIKWDKAGIFIANSDERFTLWGNISRMLQNTYLLISMHCFLIQFI